ncbi:LacI family transcriptional regulator [Bordetella sputigena]|uniref:Bug family tripartite tricarboxylate transporter substrate binding protein n=1 Tax=Bordetella sputigena TaxID=1416810 RepID=UPI0039EE0028
MRITQRLLGLGVGLCAALAALVLPGAARAQDDYPSRPVRAVVPFPAGGINDIIGRELFNALSATLKGNIVIENKPGAGGTIGTVSALNSPPDGYTLLLGAASTMAVAPHLYKSAGYTSKDLIPVGGIASVPSVVIVSANSPYKKFADLVAADKAKPGSLDYGSAGFGTSHHMQAELLNIRAGTHFRHIPYKGGAPATVDLIGGQIALLVDPLPTTLANVKAGRVRPLAITTDVRSAALPDVPTLKELGVDYNASTWFGLFVAAGTPEPIVAKLSAALTAAMKSPELQAKFRAGGIDPLTMDRQAFTRYVQEENVTWAGVIKDAHIEMQ